VRVVVTGGAGFLGSNLCRALLARGDEVVAIDNLITGTLRNVADLFGHPAFTFQHHDVSNFVHVSGAVDAVMHLASPASPIDFERIPIQILKVGSRGTQNTLGLAKEKGARYFLASTSEVYGDPLVHPQTEDYWGNVNPIGPRGVYDEAKRFAESMVMAYHRFHGVDVRIVRIFNSVLADEQVLFDDGTELRRETAHELAARLAGAVDLDGYSVPGFDSDGSIAPRAATAFVGHPPTGRCFEVATRYGRSIRVTGDHSLFVEGRDRRPEARTVANLRVGDRIAIAGRIAVPERDRRFVELAHVIDGVGRDPGSVLVKCPGLGEIVWERRFDVFAATAELRRPEGTTWRSQIWGEIASHRRRDQVPLDVARRVGIPIPYSGVFRPRTAGRAAELPAVVHISDELLWLLGLYVAEGCRYLRPGKSAFVSISCDDEVLDRAEKVFERDLGLHVVRAPGSTARAPGLFVHSVLLLELLDHLGFVDGEKRIPGWILGLPPTRLKWFLEGYREGDGVHSGSKLHGKKRHEFSTTSTRLKDDLIVALGRFGLVPSVGRYTTKLKQRTGDREYPFWRLTVADVAPWQPLDWDRGVVQKLNARRTGDVVWASVVDIAEVEPTELVYDFCVPGFENFIAGTGVLAHNTYGPSMRPDDGRAVSNFIVQALKGEPLTVYGDGSQTRSFCYVDDEIRGFLALLDGDITGPVNIGNPDEYTISQLAEIVAEVTGAKAGVVYEPLPVDDPAQRRPDITLAREQLGWEPTVGLREGVERTTEYFRSIL
jgi:UDP-glucuronate decarboxylase